MRLTYFLILFLPYVGFAQIQSMITGTVLDGESNSPLDYATISIMNASDSSLVTGGISNEEGRFAFPVKPGDYFATVQFVTYKSQNINNIKVTSGAVTPIGNVRLESSVSELGEVIVEAERTQMEMNLDKKTYNVGKDLSNLGGSASDVLSNLPSVTVDVEGNVALRGSSNVKVLIDGKPSGLVGLSSTDALRQLQGNLIESIEIITNPSARYDAEGMAGIINIILKKEKKKGVNGSFQVNTGYPHNHGASLNMNFRRDWVNFFVNYGVGYRSSPGTGKSDQEYHLDKPSETTGATDYLTQMRRTMERGGINNNLRFGADFYLNESSSLTLAFLYRYSDELNQNTLKYFDTDLDRNFLYYTEREDEETEGDTNLEYSLNYTRNFKRKEHKLTADIQYQNNSEIEKSDIVQMEGDVPGVKLPSVFQKVKNDEGEDRLMLQSDYVHPFGLNGRFEAGFRSTVRHVKNIYDVSQKENEADDFVALDEYSTDFAYDEKVHAAYGIVSNQGDRFSWQLGLRTEMTDIGSEQKEYNLKRNWNYINYFPSAFFTYKITEAAQLQMSYSRRINRPRFRELNPFSSFSDNRNFRVGNPELQPEFTDSYELGFLQNLQNSSIYYGVYYRYTQDLIQRISLQPNEKGERYQVPYNIGERHDLGVESNVSHEFSEWYRVSGNVNVYRGETIGSVGDTLSLAAKTFTFNTRISNNFKIKNVLDAQLNISYQAPENNVQGRRYSMTYMDIGMSRDVFSKNGTLALSVSDVFNTRKYRWEIDTESFSEKSTFQRRRGPSLQLTFTYRLNQSKQRPDRTKSGDGDFGDEGGF